MSARMWSTIARRRRGHAPHPHPCEGIHRPMRRATALMEAVSALARPLRRFARLLGSRDLEMGACHTTSSYVSLLSWSRSLRSGIDAYGRQPHTQHGGDRTSLIGSVRPPCRDPPYPLPCRPHVFLRGGLLDGWAVGRFEPTSTANVCVDITSTRSGSRLSHSRPRFRLSAPPRPRTPRSPRRLGAAAAVSGAAEPLTESA